MLERIALNGLRKDQALLKTVLALGLIAVGALGRILLLPYPNIETVLAASLLAGCVLGGYYGAVVPISIMLLTDAYLALDEGISFTLTGAWQSIFIFTWTGFLLVWLIGKLTGRSASLSLKSVGRLTAAGLMATIVYDFYTATGWWYLFYPHTLNNLMTVYILQIPFTLMHLLSSSIFVPLLAIPFLYLRERLLSPRLQAKCAVHAHV